VASRGALRRQLENGAGPNIADALGKSIKANLAGALLSQCAQSTILVLTALTADHVLVHGARLTTFLNLLGISVMFRDTGKVWRKIKNRMSSVVQRQRVYIIAISGKGGGHVTDSHAANVRATSTAYLQRH